MRKILLALILLLTLEVSGQAIASRVLLERIQKRWESVESLQANFVQKNIQPQEGKEMLYYGRLYLARPSMMRIDYYPVEDATISRQLDSGDINFNYPPINQLNDYTPHEIFYTDGEYVYLWRPQDNEVDKSFLTPDSLPGFMILLVGAEHFDFDKFDQNNYIKAPIPEKEEGNKNYYHLQVLPKGEDKQGRSTYGLWIEEEELLPVRTSVIGDQFISNSVLFNLQVNQEIPPDIFPIQVPGHTILNDHTIGTD